jgi:sugar phosphate isomerase/epimerase
MKRKAFVKRMALLSSAAAVSQSGMAASLMNDTQVHLSNKSALPGIKPRAITMWDFSWIERTWPGAGYEDWDRALKELKERGYNAVRIDAFPHLVAEDPQKIWTLNEVWSIQNWGSPDINKVQIQPNLNTFIAKCKDQGIKVGLSSWFRKDLDNTRMKIVTAEKHAEIWIKTLQSIEKEGLIGNLLYVDLCNEWPGDLWAPFFKNDPPELTWGQWHTDVSMNWMKTAVELVRRQFPQLLINFSFDNVDIEKYSTQDLSFFDVAEHHFWMVKENNGEFYREVKDRSRKAGRPVDIDGLFSNQVYKNLVAEYQGIYEEKPEYWKRLLTDKIKQAAVHTAKAKLPLITTECWGIVDYKDWPLLSWDWVKELCELGVSAAAETGQWITIASSNFCGPQFSGMWNDIAWHQGVTNKIKSSPIRSELLTEKVIAALK